VWRATEMPGAERELGFNLWFQMFVQSRPLSDGVLFQDLATETILSYWPSMAAHEVTGFSKKVPAPAPVNDDPGSAGEKCGDRDEGDPELSRKQRPVVRPSQLDKSRQRPPLLVRIPSTSYE